MESTTELMPLSDINQAKYRRLEKYEPKSHIFSGALNTDNFDIPDDNNNYSESDTTSQQIDNSSLNCILFTHNTALRCFVSKTLMENGSRYEKLPRFKNCAILCLTINLENKSFELKLAYDGVLSEKEQQKISIKRPYYTKDQNIDIAGYTYFNPIQGIIKDDNIKLNLLPIDLDDLSKKYNVKEFNIYEVRHGQGEHNMGQIYYHLYT